MSENQEKKEVKSSVTSSVLLESALKAARFGAFVSFGLLAVSIGAAMVAAYTTEIKNRVVAYPTGRTWEFPIVHWTNAPYNYEESAKPMFVAQKFVRAIYEVDPVDFTQTQGPAGATDAKVFLSNPLSEALAYTIPGTNEFFKVTKLLEDSPNAYKQFAECKCLKRFLIDDIMVSQPPVPQLRVEMLGRFVIFGVDGRKPLPVQDLGYKSIVLYMASDLPLAVDAKAVGDKDSKNPVKIENPEGWYVVRSEVTTLSKEGVDARREIRKSLGMVEAK